MLTLFAVLYLPRVQWDLAGVVFVLWVCLGAAWEALQWAEP